MSRAPHSFTEYRSWKSWDEESFGRVDAVQSRYFEAEFTAAGVVVRSEQSVLEIGFGNASFAAWAAGRGWRYTGIELDPELVARGRTSNLDTYTADTPIEQIAPKGGFDLIVAFDVLEHMSLEAIVTFLESARQNLKPDGRLIARFPSGDSPFSGAMQYGDITHQTSIGSGMVNQLARQAGFQVLQTRGPAFPLTGVGARRMLRRTPIKMGRALINLIFRLLYFDNQPSVVDSNMIAVLRPTHAEGSLAAAKYARAS